MKTTKGKKGLAFKAIANNGNVSESMSNGKSEQAFQIGIERMQLQLATGRFSEDKRLERANKALERIAKNEIELRKNLKGNEKIASDYTHLAKIYKEDLSHLTQDVFEKDFAAQATRFISKCRGVVTAQQKTIVAKFYLQKAQQTFGQVSAIAGLLIMKKAITEVTAKNVIKAATLPEPETANVNAQ
jgi:hypothetical protein